MCCIAGFTHIYWEIFGKGKTGTDLKSYWESVGARLKVSIAFKQKWMWNAPPKHCGIVLLWVLLTHTSHLRLTCSTSILCSRGVPWHKLFLIKSTCMINVPCTCKISWVPLLTACPLAEGHRTAFGTAGLSSFSCCWQYQPLTWFSQVSRRQVSELLLCFSGLITSNAVWWDNSCLSHKVQYNHEYSIFRTNNRNFWV